MSTIKQDRIDLERLLNGIDPIEMVGPQQPQMTAASSIVDTAPANGINTENIFNFDYDGIKKGLRKRARKSVMGIIRLVISDDSMLEEDYLKDKMEQDIDALTDLYVQQECNLTMQKALMDSVSRGNMIPRNFEVYNQMTSQAQAINKQIIETEQRIRKTYLDLKYEIQDKMSESAAALPASSQMLGCADGGTLVTTTKSWIEQVKAKHIEGIKNKDTE